MDRSDLGLSRGSVGPLRLRWGRVLAAIALALAPLVALGLFFVLPVSQMLARGLWVDGSLDFGALWSVLARPRVRGVLWFTLFSAGAGTLVSLALGLPAAYVLHRLTFPGRRLLRALMLVPFALPTVVVGVAWRQLLGESGPLGALELDRTPVAIIAGLAFFNTAVVVRAVGAAWEGLDPRPAEAAAALGASPRQVLLGVTLPALRPAIISAATVVFLFCATAFGVVLTLGGLRYSTVETEIYLLTTNLLDLQAAAALSLVQLLVIVVLLALAQRLRATADPTVSRLPTPARAPGRRDLPAIAMTAVLAVFLTAPLAALLAGSLRVGDRWGLAHFRRLWGADGVGEALATSLRTAVDATWMSLTLGVLIAVVVTRPSRSRLEGRVRTTLDGLFMLPLGVSAVTVGFGLLIALDSGALDLRDSPLLVPIAQALVALPLVVRTLAPVLAGVDERQRQAAASLGAGPLRTWLSVDLPVVRRPLVAAAGFAFAVSLGEFGATSFLAREDQLTLPIVIFRLLGRPGEDTYSLALAASVLLAAVTAAVILLVERMRVTSLGALS